MTAEAGVAHAEVGFHVIQRVPGAACFPEEYLGDVDFTDSIHISKQLEEGREDFEEQGVLAAT